MVLARLGLARCFDESGNTQRAEEELRAVLKKRSPAEARVRLARLLLTRGDGKEASELLTEVRADGQAMPKYLYKEHRPWIRLAKKLKGTSTRLPPPELEGVPTRRSPLFLAAVSIGLLLVLGIVITGVARIAVPILRSVSSVDAKRTSTRTACRQPWARSTRA